MGSLNGDIMVMRNGRSTSQVSVYNYPEHLNPFYEDDQHKRLRFWKINKKDSEGRRNSFSIGNLKDMWTFKSFRMKKKSSTLGINKTSESPPLLRRDYALDNGWNTFDNRLRANNTSSINGDSFQRNVAYRSSLQTLPTINDRIGLNRNDGYRSTIQVTRSNPRYQPQQQTVGVSQNRRYVYGGSVTPQPLRNSHANIGIGPNEYDCDNAMIRGSSQSSMVSRNPFESDDDDENEDINSSGTRSVINGSTTTLTSRTPRKKRRAPPPPTPVHGRSNGVFTPPTILIEPSHDDIQDELRIKEDSDIANLTAEIESFVKTKSNDDVEVTLRDEETPKAKSLGNNEKDEIKNVDVEREEISVQKDSIIAEEIESSPKTKINAAAKANGQITTEIVTTTTNTKTTENFTAESVEKATNVTQVTNEINTTIDESKEIKTNGALLKKPTNRSVVTSSDLQQLQTQSTPTPFVAELCIKETDTEELPQKPVPLKRQTKTEAEAEVGHIHVESPKATPRKEHPNGLLSFKTSETVEGSKTISNKTPFILTSPPVHKRNRQPTENVEPIVKETVQIVGQTTANRRTNELNIQEERISANPEILAVKPTLSPKPTTKGPNGKLHGFAEIHKPMRRSLQTDRMKKVSREDSISPPTVPQLGTREEKTNSNNKVNAQTDHSNEQNPVGGEPTQFEANNSLKIVETTTTTTNYANGNSVCTRKTLEEANDQEVKEKNCENLCETTTSVSNHVNHNDDELDLLYRPKPVSYLEWKHSSLAPLETNIPPEKRKSVKDIIESINRSQRLLNAAANKDFTALQIKNTTTDPPGYETITTDHTAFNSNNNNLDKNFKVLDEKQKESHCLVEELAPPPSTDVEYLAEETVSSISPSPSNCDNEHTEAQELDNNEIFQKCKVKKDLHDYRETSPTSSNLDWNPVPKPKRTKPGHE